jgi:glycosyltransferase involved in cell wall biosynthesis
VTAWARAVSSLHQPPLRPRVGIDCHVVDDKFQGSRTHVLALFSRVIELSRDIDFFLFLARPDALAGRPAFRAPNVHLIEMPRRHPVVRLARQLPALAARSGLDLLHTQYILPLGTRCPCMVTIHDILFETYPQHFTRVFRARSGVLMRRAARTAVHVFTVSEFSRADIARVYGVPTERISVIHNGVDTARFFPGEAGRETVLRRGLEPGGYVLSVGRLEPRKNHANLVRAHAALGPGAPPLVLVGQRDFGYRALFDALESSPGRDRVRILDDVADDELPALYRHALIFAYPAFAEGFGMPVLEAMASGVPVVTSNTTALPEVSGFCALHVPPEDVEALRRALAGLAANAASRDDLGARGLARARQFTWDAPARIVRQRYLAALRLAAGTQARP